MQNKQFVHVTNRGPFSFTAQGDTKPSGGGLASGLGGIMRTRNDYWVFPISQPSDVAFRDRFSQINPNFIPVTVNANDHRIAYEQVANQFLWFAFHGLLDLPREPLFDSAFRDAYEAFKRFNQEMANAIVERDLHNFPIIVNDYQLILLPGALRKKVPDAKISFFLHTPFPYPHEFAMLSRWLRDDLIGSLNSADLIGFHSPRWQENFLTVTSHPRSVVSPLPPDTEGLAKSVDDPVVAEHIATIESRYKGLKIIGRADRIEPSKNLLRGALSIAELLKRHPELRESFVCLMYAYPSRASLERYRSLAEELGATVEAINDRFGSARWRPIVLDLRDDPKRSMALYLSLDTLLVNPIRDGLNLVVVETASLANKEISMVVSTQAGIYDHVGKFLTGIDPLDVTATADALHQSAPADVASIKDFVDNHGWSRWLNDIDPTT